MSTRDKIAAILEGMTQDEFMSTFNDVLIGQEELLKEYFIAAFENRGVNDKQYKTDAYLLTGAILSKPASNDSQRADEMNEVLRVGYAL